MEQLVRKIIHVDMDAFFAAVEIRDHPEYRGKPLIVGGDPQSRGVVATCSYEARKFGIHSAMSSAQAYRLCPQAIFVHGRYDAYREASRQIRDIFLEYTDTVEPVSIDEAYLDVTFNKKGIPSATMITREIREKIKAQTDLTASAGVSYNKFLAKIGSDLEKPDGLVVIPPARALEVLANLPIGKFHGIGKVCERRMLELGIRKGADLKRWRLKELIRHFGKAGIFYYNIVRGHDDREVVTSRIRKSLGMERTFDTDLEDNEEMLAHLKRFSGKLSEDMDKKGFSARTMTVKIKYANFEQVSRSISFPAALNDEKIFYHFARKLLLETLGPHCKIRLLGISFSNLNREDGDRMEQVCFPFYRDYPSLLEE